MDAIHNNNPILIRMTFAYVTLIIHVSYAVFIITDYLINLSTIVTKLDYYFIVSSKKANIYIHLKHKTRLKCKTAFLRHRTHLFNLCTIVTKLDN